MPGFELFGDEERKEVNDVLETGVLMRYGFDNNRNGHWKVKELEEAIQKEFGIKYAHVCSSGTAALTIALNCLGVGAGDEVIMPTFTFVASFEAVLSVGAIPVLVDIDETLTLSPTAVQNAITSKTKVVMPVHMCGSMADLDSLKQITDVHNLFLLEDACQAIGGSYKGKKLGTIGDLGTFSFDYVKTITCGEGGAIVTNNKEVYINADAYHDHGHDHVGANRGLDKHPIIGYNFRISELNAAVGLAQIRKLDTIIDIQRKNKKIIKDILSSIPTITFRKIPDESGDNASFLSFFLPNEEITRKALKALNEFGIEACFYWFDNYWHYIREWDHLKELKTLAPVSEEVKQGWEAYKGRTFEASDAIMSRTITKLINLNWSEEQVTNIANKMKEAIESVLVMSDIRD